MTPPADSGCPDASFVEGAVDGVVVLSLTEHADERGWLVELFRRDELPDANLPAMAYVSETNPGVARGPHEHTDQSDYFAFIGPGCFRLYLWDARRQSPSYGHRQTLDVGEGNRTAVIVPPGVVHAYRNIGDVPGWVFNAPNRLYAGEGRRERVDEIRHENDSNSCFQFD